MTTDIAAYLAERENRFAPKPPVRARRTGRPRGSPRSDLVRQLLRERYACAVMPYGVQAAIALEVGLTRGRVQQIAAAMGYGVAQYGGPRDSSGERTDRVCASCGKGMAARTTATLCLDCRWINVACASPKCDKLVRRRASVLVKRVNAAPVKQADGKMASYTGRVFCDRHCFGVWCGTNYGFGVGVKKARKGAAAS